MLVVDLGMEMIMNIIIMITILLCLVFCFVFVFVFVVVFPSLISPRFFLSLNVSVGGTGCTVEEV